MANSKVPQFGAWGANDNVGYTAYFETARKGKSGGPIINPNDIQMNRDVQPPARTAAAAAPSRPTKPESKQPKFGEWDGGEEVPYTAYFENPRKGVTNPNDPQMNRDVQPSARPMTPPQPKQEPKQPKFGEWDAGEEVPYTAYFENTSKGKTNPNEPQMNRDMGASVAARPVAKFDNAVVKASDSQGRPTAVKFAGLRSVEQSPIHPRMGGGRGSGSQPSSFDSVQGVQGGPGPARPKPKPQARGSQNVVGGGASIPAFGDWNKNPGQADGYTIVFDQVQKDRRDGVGATPTRDPISTPSRYTPGHNTNQQPKDNFFSRLFGCFSS